MGKLVRRPIWLEMRFVEAVSQRRRHPGHPASTLSLWTLQESQAESCVHQDNSYIHDQAFPEAVSEEQDIYGNDRAGQQNDVKYYAHLPSHG